ncbi:MAG: purine-nucleoside phosphorylase [bacterium]
MELRDQISESTNFIRGKTAIEPEIAIILGTGMGKLAGELRDPVILDYKAIPHFMESTVESHTGHLCLGELCGKKVVMMKGRLHYYEGYTMREVTFPVRVMRALGARTLIVMNAVGSVNPLIPPGSIVLVQDHINLMGDNPLIGPNDDDLGPRFPDMSEPYSRALIARAEKAALEKKIPGVHRGVMVAFTGPSLETAAEYRMCRRMGGDIITMSTVPEVIVAAHSGMRVLGMSAVTDGCLPDALRPALLEDFIRMAGEIEPRLNALVTGVLEKM